MKKNICATKSPIEKGLNPGPYKPVQSKKSLGAKQRKPKHPRPLICENGTD